MVHDFVKRMERFMLSKKVLAIVLLATLILSLIPMLIASFYNRPYLDDYVYGLATNQAWRETGSITQVLSAAAQEVKETYYDWQGTYSAVFMFALQPGIFSEQTYYISTFFLLGILLSANFYFLHSVVVVALKRDSWTWLIISAVSSLLSIQLLPSAFGSFYWYNGVVYYTFYYALMLFLLGHLVRVSKANDCNKIVYHAIYIVLLSVIIAGGNYMTWLLTVLLFILFLLWSKYKKSKGIWAICAGLIALIAGFAVSAMAPGNAVRAIALKDGGLPSLSIVNTLWRTALMPAWYTLKWMNPALLLTFVLLIPLLWKEAKAAEHAFRYPIIVFILAYGLYASQYAPPIMMNVLGSDRHLNIFYFSFVLIAIGCLYYCFGWWQRRGNQEGVEEANHVNTTKRTNIILLRVIYAAIVLLLLSGVNIASWTSISALRSLNSGEMKQFADERDKRLTYYLDPSISDVVVEPLTAVPMVFYGDDFQDPDMWVNQAVAAFYNKRSISLAD